MPQKVVRQSRRWLMSIPDDDEGFGLDERVVILARHDGALLHRGVLEERMFDFDPSVLGGVVATVGDTVIDGTVRTHLEQLKSRL